MFYRILTAFIALYAYACLRSWHRVFGTIVIMPWWVYFLICTLSIGLFLIARLCLSMPPRVGRVFNIWSGYWLAFAFYLIMITALFDIVTLINVVLCVVEVTPRVSLISGYAVLALTCIIVIAGAWNARHFKVKRYSIALQSKRDNDRELNVVMISDIHLGDMYDVADMIHLVAGINKLSPDLVFIAGDIFDNPYTAIALFEENDIIKVFSELETRYGAYAVLGNHDSFEEGEITKSFFANTPIRILTDEAVVVDNSLVVIGRQDACMHNRASVEELMGEVNLPSVVMDHRPILLEQTRKAGTSLLLSGHTHGGQLFPFNIVAKALFDVHYGHVKRGDMHIVVSSGYGACMMPVRIGSRSEIVQIHLTI